ncbi:MAG: ABC transporter substrate-binding protein, partial [Deltaproteobacteria bacterium]|nr:ABC transporter substrate-binding protein [Deltaproteobacteria bacterium]
MSPDGKSWTFSLHKGVPFHFGFGEFTAKDVAHTHSLMVRNDATSTFSSFWKGTEKLEVVDDYQIVFRMKNPAVTMPFVASRGGDFMPVSKAQWDREGIDGLDKKPAGTGSYQYAGRKLGESIVLERVEKHWRGESPEFKELELRWAREDATRLALLLSQEAHVADLPRDLREQAAKRGVGNTISSVLPSVHLAIYFGGQYHTKGDPKFQADVAWNDKRVRQAMNMAINRKELRDALFKGVGDPVYVTGFYPSLEGWDPSWEKRFDELYGYNPTRAKALLEQAGHRPGAIKGTFWVYPRAEVPNLPQVLEGLGIYFKAVGIDMKLVDIEFPKTTALRRDKESSCCLFGLVPSYRPVESLYLIHHSTKGTSHSFEDDFIQGKLLALGDAVDPKERDRLAREMGNHMFEEFATMPLFAFFVDVVANPKVVESWAFPGYAAAGVSHFSLIKAAR